MKKKQTKIHNTDKMTNKYVETIMFKFVFSRASS